MPKPIADFIKEMMKRGAVEISPEVETLLASKPFSEAQLPDDVASKINGTFITVKDASEHKDVRDTLKGFYLGNAEQKIWRHIRDKYGWSEEQWRDFKNEDPSRSILERSEILFDRIHEAGKKAGEKLGGNQNVDEVRKQIKADFEKEFGDKMSKNQETIRTLESKLGEQETTLKQTKEDATKQVLNLKRDYYLDSVIASLPVRKDLIEDPDLRKTTIQTIREKFINEAELVDESGKWELRQKSDPTAKYLKENKPITPEELAKDVASKYLDPNVGKPKPENGYKPAVPANNGSGTPPSPFAFKGPAKIDI